MESEGGLAAIYTVCFWLATGVFVWIAAKTGDWLTDRKFDRLDREAQVRALATIDELDMMDRLSDDELGLFEWNWTCPARNWESPIVAHDPWCPTCTRLGAHEARRRLEKSQKIWAI